jgi:tetratricopeptide (TPR) repeat protein
MGRYKNLTALAALAALVFLIYSNVLNGPFIFDDGMYIATNQQIKDLSLLWPPSPRYLTFLSFALNYAVGGLDTFGYHFFNVAVHAVNSALVFALATILFNTPLMKEKGFDGYACPAAIAASFLFAAHPVQTQAVSYITQRFASLTALFYLLSLVSYLKWRTSENNSRFIFYAIAFFSAMAAQFTKETGFTLPAVMVLTEFVFFRRTKGTGRRAAALLPFLLVMAIVPFLLFGQEFSAGSGTGVSETTRRIQLRDLESVSAHDYLATQFRVMATYLSLLVLPVGQNIDYDYPLLRSFLLPEVILSAALVASVFILGVYLLVRGRSGRSGCFLMAGYGIIFFFMAISVESSIIPINDVIYEHRLYLPDAGAAIFFSALLMGVFAFLRNRSVLKASALAWAVCVTAAIAVPLSAATWSRNNLWADEVLFWRDAAAKSPQKARVRNNLGNVLYKKGLAAEGMAEFRKAAELAPSFADARYNLGTAYKDLGMMEKAIIEFEAAVRSQPGKLNARNNLGLAYYTVGKYGEAEGQFKYILSANPGDYRARNHLGLVYSRSGRTDEAASEFRRALSINPAFEPAADNLRQIEMGGMGRR